MGTAVRAAGNALRGVPLAEATARSPVHGAFRAAVLGPTFRSGESCDKRHVARVLFTGLLAVGALANSWAGSFAIQWLKPKQREAP
jgi:hypothetical protein